MKIKATILAVLLCLYWGLVIAQELNEEQYLDGLSDERFDETYIGFEPYSIGINFASKLADNPYMLGALQVKAERWKVQTGMKLSIDTFNPSAFPDPDISGTLAANIQLSYDDMIYLGSLRPAFGSGLLFKEAKSGRSFYNTPDPMNYTPFGLGVRLDRDKMHVMALYSVVSRMALLRGNKIERLYANKADDDFKVQEQIGALSFGYKSENLHGALVFATQNYSKDFLKDEIDKDLLNLNLTAGYYGENNQLRGELGLQEKGLALKAEWEGKWDNFSHKWHYRHLGNYQLPTYAKSVYFKNERHQEELGAAFNLDLDKRSKLSLNSTANKITNTPGKNKWMLNSGADYSYSDKSYKFKLALRRIDRELLAEYDEGYLSTIPANWRFLISGEARVAKSLSLTQSARYHYQEKKASLNSGFVWNQGLKWEQDKFWTQLGARLHNSTNFNMVLFSDDASGYESLSKDGVRGELELGYKFEGNKGRIRYIEYGDARELYFIFDFTIHKLP
ncbi:MAG: hypothetical protein LHW60_00435 [Candidatus Cloacimonetes bacterium]|nr:hypothetical protein [Candidatus Cloacimonadota bacterium]NLO44701.1 hypothetical protein [Candidatus Cloacimonadota bacterium]